MGSGGALLSDLSGDRRGGMPHPPGIWKLPPSSPSGLDPVPALPQGRPEKWDLDPFLGWMVGTVLIFVLFLGGRVIDFLQQQLTRALEVSFE